MSRAESKAQPRVFRTRQIDRGGEPGALGSLFALEGRKVQEDEEKILGIFSNQAHACPNLFSCSVFPVMTEQDLRRVPCYRPLSSTTTTPNPTRHMLLNPGDIPIIKLCRYLQFQQQTRHVRRILLHSSASCDQQLQQRAFGKTSAEKYHKVRPSCHHPSLPHP